MIKDFHIDKSILSSFQCSNLGCMAIFLADPSVVGGALIQPRVVRGHATTYGPRKSGRNADEPQSAVRVMDDDYRMKVLLRGPSKSVMYKWFGTLC